MRTTCLVCLYTISRCFDDRDLYPSIFRVCQGLLKCQKNKKSHKMAYGTSVI